VPFPIRVPITSPSSSHRMSSPLVSSSLFSTGTPDFTKVGHGSGAAVSRSTSAGSSFKDGRLSANLSKPPSPLEGQLYPRSDCPAGLPNYEYPSPWSSKLPEFHYPVPFTVKNTFIGTNLSQPSSLLEGFYAERQTQSCPTSGISLPPGLEDLVEPEEAAARFIAIEAARRREAEAKDFFQSTSTFGLPCSQIDAPSFLMASPQRQPFDACPFDVQGQPPFFAFPSQAPPLPLPLDSLLAAEPQQHSMQSPYFAAEFTLPFPPSMPPSFAAQQAPAPAEPALGSPECPTVGSQGHVYGSCKPCAFLYTKGCGNGVSCDFCHLCDAGEKKRRAKGKRAIRHTDTRQGAGTIVNL